MAGMLRIAKSVGSVFGLASAEGVYRISQEASFWSEDELAVLFYTQRWMAGRWVDCAKGTFSELRREAMPLSRGRLAQLPESERGEVRHGVR